MSQASAATQFTPLTPEQEQAAIDVVVKALNLSLDNLNEGAHPIAQVLAISYENAVIILHDLYKRRIIQTRTVFETVAEAGIQRAISIRWERTEIPTTLEIIEVLLDLGEVFSLDESRQALRKLFNQTISEDEASGILGELQERDILTLRETGSVGRKWVRVGSTNE